MFNRNLIKKYENNFLLYNKSKSIIACSCDKKVIQAPKAISKYFKSDLHNKYYTCPNCKTKHDLGYVDWKLLRPMSFVIFDDSEKDGKLREKSIAYEYMLTKNGVISKKITLSRIMNLKTGMVYTVKSLKGDKMVSNSTYFNEFGERAYFMRGAISNYKYMDLKIFIIKKIIDYKKKHLGMKFYNDLVAYIDDKVTKKRLELNDISNEEELCFVLEEELIDVPEFKLVSAEVKAKDRNIRYSSANFINKHPSIAIEATELNMPSQSDIKGLNKIFKSNDIYDFKYLKNKGIDVPKYIRKKYSKDAIRLTKALALDKILNKKENLNKLDFLFDGPSHVFWIIEKFLKLYKWKYKNKFKKNENEICNHIKKLFQSGTNRDALDAFEMFTLNYNNLETPFSFRNLRDTHDRLVNSMRKAKQKNMEIAYEKDDYIIELKTKSWNFVLAKDTDELCDVGSKMSICVGSYGQRAIDRNVVILIGYNNENEPELCIEYEPNEKAIYQFKFKNNRRLFNKLKTLSEEEVESVKAILNNFLDNEITLKSDFNEFEVIKNYKYTIENYAEIYKLHQRYLKRKNNKEIRYKNMRQARKDRKAERKLRKIISDSNSNFSLETEPMQRRRREFGRKFGRGLITMPMQDRERRIDDINDLAF